ncbi:MAG: hypothetical protein MZV65_10305 [Chromatiales bacterium]|nr:hypothetical protein [Chromatiales bacterium]
MFLAWVVDRPQPPVIDMKRTTCPGCSLNSWRSGFSLEFRRTPNAVKAATTRSISSKLSQ